MKESEKMRQKEKYDTAINIIGGLSDCNIINNAINTYFEIKRSEDGSGSAKSIFNLRTERSNTRTELAVRKGFLTFRDQNHESLFEAIFQNNDLAPNREIILFWQFALNNRLFREISTQVFIKTYLSGRVGLSKDDIIAFLKELINRQEVLKDKWTETTINTLATKYLNLMTKLNFLEGSRTKKFKHISMSQNLLTIFIYLSKLFAPHNPNILTNPFLPLSFIPSEYIQDRLKKPSLKGYFNMNYNGVLLNIDLIHSYRGICDVIYK